MSDFFFVSVVVPCRDEEKFIGKCLDSIIANDYPKDRLEILLVDGMSKDETREIIESYAHRYPFIRLLNNPKKITSVALNIGITHAKGEIIIRMDTHAVYEKYYLSKCINYLQEYNADNVGGTMITLPRNSTLIGKAIAISMSHKFGVGGSVFRTGSKMLKWVDTVFGGCYRKEVFEKIGLFNEKLIFSQDMEFNLRLKKAGGRTLFVPEIVSYYYARSNFKAFCKHNFRNGVWVIVPFKFTTIIPVSWRHLVPLVFVASLVSSPAFSIFSSIFYWLFLLIIGSYLLANLYFSGGIAIREKNFRYFFLMPIIFATFHISYGLGSIWGLMMVSVSRSFWGNLKSILMRG